jgi:hypothetical protein
MSRHMNRRAVKFLLPMGIVILCIFAALYWTGQNSGRKSGEQTKARLELVWPSLMTLPETDRALLAGLSMTCQMEHRPIEAAEVIVCLREAASNPDAVRPKGMGQVEAAARLETLITQAQEK